MSDNENELKLGQDDEYEAEIDRLYFESLQEGREYSKASRIPSVVEKYVKNAVEVSINNEVPAMLSFYLLLGQISKDMVCIPAGKRRIDTRVQVIWMQTSGTGKTEMYNFFGPVSKLVFDELNSKYGSDINDFEKGFKTIGEHNRQGAGYQVIEVGESTDAGMVGSMGEEEETVVDDDTGQTRTVTVPVQNYGQLEGEGLLIFDEFHDSGVFSKTQHRNNIIYYLNTLMNTLWGQNWRIRKKKLEGGEFTCNARLSSWATTYIPKTLTTAISETGAMQRSIIYIREVPIEEQNMIRETIADDYGVIIDDAKPIQQYADAFVQIYETLREHYIENGEDPLKTVTFAKGFNQAIKNETFKFQQFVQNSRPAVMEVANNFITRMQGMMVKLAVISCIAESGTVIKNKDKRFIVTEKHVRQGAYLTRQCYKSLVSWLDLALKAERKSLQERAMLGEFKKAFVKLSQTPEARTIDGERWINKTTLFQHIMTLTRRGQAQVYRNYKEVSEHFDEKRVGRYGYVKLKRSENQ
tara:strand:+ start:5906 stop:7480 length:1575 start_codon:yes stop_codon:yes gene_type:complete